VVVVAAGRHERGRAEVGDQLEAEQVAVEGQALLDVADAEVHVTDAEAGARVAPRRLALDRGEQPGEVERLRTGAVGLLGRGPLRPRPVRGELEAVAVGVGEVDRLVGQVVRRARDRDAPGGEPQRRARELLARGMQERDVEEPGVAARAARAGALVQDEDGLLAAGPQRDVRVAALAGLQAEDVLIEGDGAVEVGDDEAGGAEPQAGGQQRRHGSPW